MSPLAKLHTQLINLQDHIQALRALAAAGGDAGIVQLTGNQIDRLLAPVDDAVCECVEILEDAADATAKAKVEEANPTPAKPTKEAVPGEVLKFLDRVNKDPMYGWRSLSNISACTGLPEGAVQDALHDLVMAGLVEVDPGSSTDPGNAYRIVRNLPVKTSDSGPLSDAHGIVAGREHAG